MKRIKIKIVSLILAAVIMISFVSICAASEYTSENWYKDHYSAVNMTGCFNKSSVVLYKNPVELPDDKTELSGDMLPAYFTVRLKLTESSGTEWYVIDSESLTRHTDCTYVSVDDVTLKDSAVNTAAANCINAASIIEEISGIAFRSFALKRTLTTAAPEPIETNAPDGLVMDKKAEETESGEYKITLEAYTTGTVKEQKTTKPMDIVLVIDQSGSMSWDLYSYKAVYSPNKYSSSSYYVKNSSGSYIKVSYCDICGTWTDGCSRFHITKGTPYYPKTSETDADANHTQFYEIDSEKTQRRLDALKAAVNTFVESVEKKAAEEGVNHRIAIVGFSSDRFNNTELLTGVAINKANRIYDSNDSYYPDGYAHNGAQYGNISVSQYQNALQDASTDDGKASIANAIDALTAHGGTYTLDGLDMAYNIFENNTIQDENRNKAVILFTDGATNSEPGEVINKAYDIKNDFNATVYSVGIFDGANGDLSSHTDDIEDTNTMMHAISSNFPDAYCTYKSGRYGGSYEYSSGNVNADLTGNESYYLSADNTESLNDIFVSISSQIGSETVNLGSDAVIKDVVSPYFDIPENSSEVTVQSFDCISYRESTGDAVWSANGTSVSSSSVQIDNENSAVNVTGYDFNANYISETGRDETDDTKAGTFHGRKLVITFNVSVKDEFWGGNNVPTNGEQSGIYTDEESSAIGTFRVPTVNIPVKSPQLMSADKNIYLCSDVPELNDLFTSNIPVSAEDAWKTAYVNIDGPSFSNPGTVISNREDTTDIGITVTVSPKYNGVGADCGTPNSSDGKTAEAFANVYVFKPFLTYMDTFVYYGDYAPTDFNAEDLVSEEWKHIDTLDTSVTMFGEKPGLTVTYSTVEGIDNDGKIVTKQDIPVKVGKVEISGTDITEYTGFLHQDCVTSCNFDPDNEQFILHVKTCSLTVEKRGGADEEPYIFYIEKDGEKYTEFTVNGNGKVSLYELPIGTYTIKEDTSWSWRYDPDPTFNKDSVTLSAAQPEDEIICTNTGDTDRWINGFSTVIQNVFGISKNG